MEAIRYPAGLDLGARTAPEVALSILAEIVQQRPSDAVQMPGPEAATVTASPSLAEASAIDPVCGLEVVIVTAKHQADLEGTTYYFCCPHCRAHFLRDPHSYLAAKS
jgi:xanthine dehydrogenase accessory factor